MKSDLLADENSRTVDINSAHGWFSRTWIEEDNTSLADCQIIVSQEKRPGRRDRNHSSIPRTCTTHGEHLQATTKIATASFTAGPLSPCFLADNGAYQIGPTRMTTHRSTIIGVPLLLGGRCGGTGWSQSGFIWSTVKTGMPQRHLLWGSWRWLLTSINWRQRKECSSNIPVVEYQRHKHH